MQGWVQFEGVSFSYQPGENVPGAAAGLAEVARFGWGRGASLPPLSQERGALKTERPKSEASPTASGDDARRRAATQRSPTAIRATRCAR